MKKERNEIMLDVEIKHDIDKNYLVVHGSDENTYMLKMLAGNSVKGFLDLEVRVLNNVNQYYYDITGKENFLQKSARGKWTEEELRKTVSDILGSLQKSKEYLLTPEHFVLEPQYMYRSMESGEVFLCYAWNYEKNINEQLTELFAYFMNVVDYEDNNAVDLVYKLYDVSREENCTLQRSWSALAVPKVKLVIIEEEPVEEEVEEKTTYRTRRTLGLRRQEEKPTSRLRASKKQGEQPVPKPHGLKKQGEKLSPKPHSLKKQGEKLSPKPHSLKKQGEKPTPKPYGRKRQGEITASRLLSTESEKTIETSKKKLVSEKREAEVLGTKRISQEKRETIEISMPLKILLIVALQLAIIGVIFVGAKYGFFYENSGISYTKTGGTLLILGVVDMYLMMKIFGVEDNVEKSEEVEQEEDGVAIKAKSDSRRRTSSSKRPQQAAPFVLAEEAEQSVTEEKNKALQRKAQFERENNRREFEYKNNIRDEIHNKKLQYEMQNNRLDKEISVVSPAASQDLDGTVVLDYEKTIVDNQAIELLHNKKVCYLVPDEKDYSVISLGEFPFFIGRFQKDTGSLKEIKNISRMHSKIEQIGSSFFITDLNSTNGTFVNQKRLERNKKMELYEGDEVTFANVPYHFTMQEI